MNLTSSRTSRRDLMVAGSGAVLSIILLALGMVLVGRVSGGEARAMLEAMMPTTRFLCSAVMGAASTVLALMLTLLSLSAAAEDELRDSHYRRVRQLALITASTFIGATALLCLHSVPFAETSIDNADLWYRVIYYTLLGGSALLGGALTAIGMMLYFAIRDMISVLAPGVASHLVSAGDDEDPEQGPEGDAESQATS